MNTNRFNELITALRKDFKGHCSFKVETYENETIMVDMISQPQQMQLCRFDFKNIMVVRNNLIDFEIVFKGFDCHSAVSHTEAIKIIVKTFERG